MTVNGTGQTARRVSVPVARNEVRRARLLDDLDVATSSQVLLVCAPAGYGKSMLVASWLLDRAVENAVWVNLSATPPGSAGVWATVVAGLSAALPDPAGELAAIAVLAVSKPDELAARLGRWLIERGRDTVLVLDDLHAVSDSGFHAGLVELVAAAGDRLHLIVITRHDPPWPLHRMRAEGLLRDLRADALAFDNSEAETMFGLIGIGVEPTDVADLVSRTQGWAAGLRLAALGATSAPDPGRFVASISGRSDYIADYLMREVYQGLDREWRNFLARIGVVDDICAELAEALGAGPESADRLDQLVRQNAFIHQLGDRSGWYRLHPLVVDFLRSRATDRRQQRSLHSRAAEWFRDQDEPLTALQHAIAGQDWELVSELADVNVVSWTVLRPPAELQRSLAPVPREQILTRPGLALGFAASLAMQGQLAGVEELLDAARGQMSAATGQRRRRLEFVLDVISVGIRRWRGELEAVLDGYRQMPTDPATLNGLGLADWDAVRTLLIGNRGVCELWTGETSAAREHLSEAARVDGNRSVNLSTLNAQSHRAFLHWADGELTAAHELAYAALRDFTDLQVPGAVQAQCAYLALAGVALDRDDLQAARRWLEIARDGADEPHTAFATELVYAQLLAAEGKPIDAVAALRRGRDVATALPIAAAMISESLRVEDRLLRLTAMTAPTDVLPTLPGEDTLRARVESHVRNAMQAWSDERFPQAMDEIERALRLASREDLRRPFLGEGAEIGQLIGKRIERGTDALPFAVDLASRTTSPAVDHRRHPRIFVPLTQRETNILHYLETNLRVQDIANTLYISMNTIKTHQRSIYAKLGAGGRREAVAHARELGLL